VSTEPTNTHAVPSLLAEVAAERMRQDAKWGGPAHDDHHSTAELVQLIEDYAGWARTMAGMNSSHRARQRLVQVAALALAACERIDRAQLRSSAATALTPDRVKDGQLNA
jgi:hypothetical protein